MLAESWLSAIAPLKVAEVVMLEALAVQIAYGDGVSGWRGASGTNDAPPLVRTAISSQRGGPVNTPAPKSSVIVNSPSLTAMALVVSVRSCCVSDAGGVEEGELQIIGAAGGRAVVVEAAPGK